LIAVVDGLKGFPEAIATVFPLTTVQTCIIHLKEGIGFVKQQGRFAPLDNPEHRRWRGIARWQRPSH
jgi:putative transposase